MSDEQDESCCKRCHATCFTPEGLEPTDYCNLCAQGLVPALEAVAKAAREALRTQDILDTAPGGPISLDFERAGRAAEALRAALVSLGEP